VSGNEKLKFIRLIESSETSISVALARYDLPRSTYYRWKRKLRTRGIQGLKDGKPHRARIWNQLLPRQQASDRQWGSPGQSRIWSIP